MLVFAILFGMIVLLIRCGEQSCLTEAEELGPNTVTIETTKYGDLYEFGVILVRYDYEQKPASTTDIPVAPVKDFFAKKGYSPKVIDRVYNFQIVTIGRDMDPSLLMK